MNDAVKRQRYWASVFKFYGKQNENRATRLGVFDGGNDYWIEDGLPLNGIDFDPHHNSVEIMFGNELTHTIKEIRKFQINFSVDEINDGLDITDAEGITTILRFE